MQCQWSVWAGAWEEVLKYSRLQCWSHVRHTTDMVLQGLARERVWKAYIAYACSRSGIASTPVHIFDRMNTVPVLQPKQETEVDISQLREHVRTTLTAYDTASIKWILSGWYKSGVRARSDIAMATRFHLASIRPERVLDVPVMPAPERFVPGPLVAPDRTGRPLPQEIRADPEQAEAAPADLGERPTTSDGRTAHPEAAPTARQVCPHVHKLYPIGATTRSAAIDNQTQREVGMLRNARQ